MFAQAAVTFLIVFGGVVVISIQCPFSDSSDLDDHVDYSFTKPVHCDKNFRYVQPSGACNNLNEPRAGSSYSPYSRLVPAAFDDGLATIRTDAQHRSLPGSRKVANAIADINTFRQVPIERFNHAAVIFGLFVQKDLSWNKVYQPVKGDGQKHCCAQNGKHLLEYSQRRLDCYSLDEDECNDPFGIGCVDMVRVSQPFAGHSSSSATAFANNATHYLDQSNIYGPNEEALSNLRLFRGGQLRMSSTGVLPQKSNCTAHSCYFSGDARAINFPTSTIFHSLFHRMHNVHARGLAAVNPHWTDEQLFQESRRLATAVYQNCIYNDWLPLAIGGHRAQQLGLSSQPGQMYSGSYDPTLDARVFGEFPAALREMHVNMPLSVNLYDRNYELQQSIDMDVILLVKPDILETSYLEILRGMTADSASFDIFPDFLRKNILTVGATVDVLALDIARARDHGLAPYTVYYQKCLGRKVTNWMDLLFDFSYSSIRILQQLYVGVQDIELNVGLLLEEKRNEMLGPVTRCLFAEQFLRLMNGDRFFYSLPNGAYPFSAEQLGSIQRMKFADILCLATEINQVQARAWEPLSAHNPLRDCAPNTIDYQLWQDAYVL